ncbi:hypothetical protein [Ensifer aridi]|uniref:hypothetical protein n=1 Tax=Ensifer aridi TaxID=1708715 RepID=UPI00111C750A|nr:hypothetical protein [Ensifer aridi]
METKTYELNGGSMEMPIYVNHRRGRNWIAILSGKNAANVERQFLKSRGKTVDLTGVTLNSVLEIAADYTTSTGRRDPHRLYQRVVSLSETELAVECHPSMAEAMKAAHKAAA